MVYSGATGWTPVYYTGFSPIWSIPYSQAVTMIKEAVQGERNDELFYDELIRLAPSTEEKDMITGIRNDERGHNRMFRDMYRALTGQEIPAGSDEAYVPVTSYKDGLKRAFNGELGAVERYRKIWFGLPAGIYRDTLFGIILDELKHADKYTYLVLTAPDG